MGYHTNFDLSFNGTTMEQVVDAADKMLGEHNYINELEHYNTDADGTEHWGANSKWTTHDNDLETVSRVFPGVLFTLKGNGEEEGDLWVAYFKDGRSVYHKAEIVYPEFKEEDLLSTKEEN